MDIISNIADFLFLSKLLSRLFELFFSFSEERDILIELPVLVNILLLEIDFGLLDSFNLLILSYFYLS